MRNISNASRLGNWTWITGLNDESFQNLQLDLDDVLNNTDGDWANAVFQNFIWGSEDPIKVQREYMLLNSQICQ